MTCARWMINRAARPDGECLRGASDFSTFTGNLNLQFRVLNSQKMFMSASHARPSQRRVFRGAEFTPSRRIDNTFSRLEKLTGKHVVNSVDGGGGVQPECY